MNFRIAVPVAVVVGLVARTSGATPLEWFVTQTLTVDMADGGPNSSFGSPVAISGTNALIGGGGAYMFAQAPSTGIWSLSLPLVAAESTPGDDFGSAVALTGATAIVGAGSTNFGSSGLQGAAYVFVQSGGTWTEQQQLLASDGEYYDLFGCSVALDGDTVAIGAKMGGLAMTGGADGRPGAVYVFVQSGGTWTQQQELVSSDPAGQAWFGGAVALSGDTLVVGEPGNPLPGAVYVFVRSGTTWTEQAKLVAADSTSSAQFGGSLAIEGSTLLVGSYVASYVYTQSGSTWTLEQELPVVSEPNVGGYAAAQNVSLNGSTLAVVGPGNAFFTETGATWSQQPSQIGGSNLSVSLSNGIAVDGNYGAVYICTLQPANGIACTADSQCGSDNCVAGICCNTTCGPCGDCSTGTCILADAGAGGSPACAPLVCNGSAVTCLTACSTDTDCIASDYCLAQGVDGGVDDSPDATVDAGPDAAGAPASGCVPKLALAATCTTNHQCISGSCEAGVCQGTTTGASSCTADDQCATNHCVDGVCCDSACTGQCEACDVAGSAGLCSPVVSGAPHGTRPACTGPDAGAGAACTGTCNGTASTTVCQYPPATTPCGSACAGSQTSLSTCDGEGHCVGGPPQSCPGNLVCTAAGDGCKASCDSDGDCVAGYGCQAGACVPRTATCTGPHTSQNGAASGDAGTTDCTPYLCDPGSGACKTACTSADDCVVPNLCSTTNHCVAPPSGPSSAAGCGCRQAPAPPAPPAVLAGGLAAAVVLAGRRRRRRTRS